MCNKVASGESDLGAPPKETDGTGIKGRGESIALPLLPPQSLRLRVLTYHVNPFPRQRPTPRVKQGLVKNLSGYSYTYYTPSLDHSLLIPHPSSFIFPHPADLRQAWFHSTHLCCDTAGGQTPRQAPDAFLCPRRTLSDFRILAHQPPPISPSNPVPSAPSGFPKQQLPAK